MAEKSIDTMTKAELAALGATLGLGSRSALSARYKENLRKDIRKAQKGE